MPYRVIHGTLLRKADPVEVLERSARDVPRIVYLFLFIAFGALDHAVIIAPIWITVSA